MGRNGNEEEVGPIRVVGAERALTNVLEEVALAGVLAGELPGGLVEGFGIAVGVDVHLEIPHHPLVVRLKDLRRVVNRRG